MSAGPRHEVATAERGSDTTADESRPAAYLEADVLNGEAVQSPNASKHGMPAGAHPASALADELTEDEVAEVLAAFHDAVAGRRVVSRQLSYQGVQSFLRELQRNPSIVTVIAKNDFPYFGRDSRKPVIEREYWLRVSRASLSDKSLVGRDDFIILHVHYAGDWNWSDDQATFDRKRSQQYILPTPPRAPQLCIQLHPRSPRLLARPPAYSPL